MLYAYRLFCLFSTLNYKKYKILRILSYKLKGFFIWFYTFFSKIIRNSFKAIFLALIPNKMRPKKLKYLDSILLFLCVSYANSELTDFNNFTLCGKRHITTRRHARIVGGTNSTHGNFPWQVCTSLTTLWFV